MAKKKRSKWVTLIKEDVNRWDDVKGEWVPACLKDIKGAIEDAGYDVGLEISVIRKNYRHGFDSWGWGGTDKIILFDANEAETVADIEWMKKVAETTADALNKKEL